MAEDEDPSKKSIFGGTKSGVRGKKDSYDSDDDNDWWKNNIREILKACWMKYLNFGNDCSEIWLCAQEMNVFNKCIYWYV